MKQTRLYALFLVFCAVCAAWAQDVTLRQAEGIAADFFKSRGIKSTAPQKAQRRAAARQNGNSPYYIFNNSDESAFVIVSGDSRTKQVLAYSTENAFDTYGIAPGAEYMLEMYEAYIDGLQNGTVAPVTRTDWGVTTEKLIETANWGQTPNPVKDKAGAFWWAECPIVNGERTPAGCVAAAMAILLRHYQWPMRGFGNKNYTTSTLGLNVFANFEEVDYNWASLPMGNERDAGWNNTNKPIASKILKQCGVAASMDYKIGGSSATFRNAAVGLYKYFGYKLGNLFFRRDCSDDEWYNAIVKEINNDNPVMIQGADSNEGYHAYVCDGYKPDGYLHYNLGWNGSSNGYYSMYGTDLYYDDQSFLIGLQPDYNVTSLRESCDMYLADNVVDESTTGLRLWKVDKIYRGEFWVQPYCIYNLSEKATTIKVGAFICDGSNRRKVQIGETDWSFEKSNYIGFNYVQCTIPFDYSFDEKDYICLYSSIDDGATWKKVECYAPQLVMIKMADVYDPADLLMNVEEGKDAGLTLYNNNSINLNGTKFWVQCNLLKNMLGVTFNGEIAAFLCDKNGNKKKQIGNKTINPDVYVSGSRYGTISIQCAITNDMDVALGDRICVYSRLNGYDWVYVDCEDASKAYITIPESLIVEKEITKFKTAHAAILAKTTSNVTKSDLEAIEKALADYSKLSSVAKAQLTAEKKLLDALKEKAEKAIAGDVNSDGKVNIADATMLVGYIVNGQATSTSFVKAAADVNGDGKINIADVTAIIKTIVNQ